MDRFEWMPQARRVQDRGKKQVFARHRYLSRCQAIELMVQHGDKVKSVHVVSGDSDMIPIVDYSSKHSIVHVHHLVPESVLARAPGIHEPLHVHGREMSAGTVPCGMTARGFRHDIYKRSRPCRVIEKIDKSVAGELEHVIKVTKDMHRIAADWSENLDAAVQDLTFQCNLSSMYHVMAKNRLEDNYYEGKQYLWNEGTGDDPVVFSGTKTRAP